MKPINIDQEDIGLHDTDNSELSTSTASNSMLPQLEETDVEKAQNEEERRRRRVARKEKREAREEGGAVRREESKKRRKKTQERSLKKKKRRKKQEGTRSKSLQCIFK